MAEVVSRREMHVEHGHEAGADDEIEYPLECHGDGHGRATDSVGEYLGDKHPCDRTPAEHEARAVDHDGDGRYHFHARLSESDGHAERAYGHTDAAAYQKWLAAKFLYIEDGHQREEDVDDTHHHGEHHLVVHAHVLEDAGSVVEHGVDTYRLLEYGEHDAHEDTHETIGEELLGLHRDGVLDFGENLLRGLRAIDAREHVHGAVVPAYHYQVARSLRHEADEDGEEQGGYALRAKHISPACGNGPLRVGHVGDCACRVIDGVGVVAQYQEIDKVNHQLAKDDGELVPAHQHAADIGRGHLANIHGANGRSHTYTDAAQNAIEVEYDEQVPSGYPVREQPSLGIHGAPSGDEETYTGEDKRAFTP